MNVKWLFGFSLFLLGLGVGRISLWDRTPAWAGGTACLDGDVDGSSAVNITDAVFLLNHLFRGGPPPAPCTPTVEAVSTVVLVRHAEKETGDDPGLTPCGIERARSLAAVFKNAKPDFLIASEKLRTQQTLQPIAALFPDIPPMDRIGDEATPDPSSTAVVQRLRAVPPGRLTVVAHHSTTIRLILDKLGVAGSQEINTGINDNFVIVQIPASGAPFMLPVTYPCKDCPSCP